MKNEQEAYDLHKKYGKISATMLVRKFKINWNSAENLRDLVLVRVQNESQCKADLH